MHMTRGLENNQRGTGKLVKLTLKLEPPTKRLTSPLVKRLQNVLSILAEAR